MDESKATVRDAFKELDRLEGVDISQEGCKFGKDIAKAVLREFPNFPTGVKFEESLSPDKDLFVEYCINKFVAIKVSEGTRDIPLEPSILFGDGFKQGAGEFWDDFQNCERLKEQKYPYLG